MPLPPTMTASANIGSLRRADLPDAPAVTGFEWVLLMTTLVSALAGFAFESNRQLALLAEFTFGIELTLVGVAVVESFRNKVMGKTLLAGAMVAFYYQDAFRMVTGDVPFNAGSAPVSGGQFDPAIVQLGLVYVAVFQLMLFVGYSCRVKLYGVCRWVRSRSDRRGRAAWSWRYVFAAFAILPLFLSFSWDPAAVQDAISASRSGTATVDASDIGLLGHLFYFGMYGCGLLLVEGLFFRKIGRVPSLLLTGVLGVPVIFGATRHITVFVILPAVAVALKRVKGRIPLNKAIGWGLLVLLLLGLTQLQLAVRNNGWQALGEVTTEDLATPGVGEFGATLFALYLVPDRHEYFLEPIEPYFVIHWIPRSVWTNKPIPESWAYYNASYTQGAAYNVTPSVIGQFHLNFGLPGVVYIGLLLGFLMATTDRAMMAVNLERQLAMSVLLGSMYAFLVSSFRFFHPLYFAYVLFAAIAMTALTRRVSAMRAPARRNPAELPRVRHA